MNEDKLLSWALLVAFGWPAEEVGVVEDAEAVEVAVADPAMRRSAQTYFLPSAEVSWIWMVILSPDLAPSYVLSTRQNNLDIMIVAIPL